MKNKMNCTVIHPLRTDIPKPERFTYPFCYEPHPLAVAAAEVVQRELAKMELTEGKMFGVLVVETENGYGFLAAYSGLLEGRNDWDYFVPPVYDAQQPDGHFKKTEREISKISLELRTESLEFPTGLQTGSKPSADSTAVANSKLSTLNSKLPSTAVANSKLSTLNSKLPSTAVANSTLSTLNSTLIEQRRRLSEDLQLWLFHQYQLLNARGEKRDLVDVWQDYHCSAKIRRRYPLPPGGTGDCCAPKLLQYAYLHGLKPVCMAEFWWGPSPKSEVRHHGQFYPACRGKCKPVLTWMLQGLDVDPNPEEAGFPRLVPEVVYEDDALAVLNKPSGMLSIPGRSEDYSVATWAQRRWPGAMLVHRLDMWTSGLIVVAKNKEAYLHLQEQFVKHTIKKRYIAVLDGMVSPPEPEGTKGRIELPLLRDPMNRPRQIVDYQRGKTAVTEYEVLRSLPDRTLVALYPHTGRTHQLRVHCAHEDGLGCPIHGDELYGRAKQTLGGAAEERLSLHADRLELTHPSTGERMHFELPYPFGNLMPFNNK